MSMPAVPVLTYHGYNVAGNDYHNNDHVALAADLEWLAAAGWRLVPLEVATRALFEGEGPKLPERSVAISFDDGTDLDWHDVEFGAFGHQRGLARILADWQQAGPDRRGAHATSFVIASPEARAALADQALSCGHRMSAAWWSTAAHSGLVSIGNHSWDHRHPLVVPEAGGHFFGVDDEVQADLQVRQAAVYIAGQCGVWPRLFAYPWGQASDYLRTEYFPQARDTHGCIAAFGTEPAWMHAGSDRWHLPRFVCGEHWRSPQELAALLADA
jgi:peptidoglycan/xylan/chitin deacetylase (PgdA/CDA1 family)